MVLVVIFAAVRFIVIRCYLSPPPWQALPGGNCVPCSFDAGHWFAMFPGGDIEETQVNTVNNTI